MPLPPEERLNSTPFPYFTMEHALCLLASKSTYSLCSCSQRLHPTSMVTTTKFRSVCIHTHTYLHVSPNITYKIIQLKLLLYQTWKSLEEQTTEAAHNPPT
jgi:hypothetical protein